MVDFSFIVSLYVSDLPNVTISNNRPDDPISPFALPYRMQGLYLFDEIRDINPQI